ncbi:hypothetical protein SUGI_0310340 [Cryptomeria japonica]|nr:hypothetical protein SUGI_0310340 [Cryptomeria japonica]
MLLDHRKGEGSRLLKQVERIQESLLQSIQEGSEIFRKRELEEKCRAGPGVPAGAKVETLKKFDGGQNKKTQQPVVNARKLEEETEPAALQKISPEVRQAIQKARLEQKMSQAELAKRINERPQVVQEYESGKAVPNQAILSKMERALGIKLRGKISK